MGTTRAKFLNWFFNFLPKYVLQLAILFVSGSMFEKCILMNEQKIYRRAAALTKIEILRWSVVSHIGKHERQQHIQFTESNFNKLIDFPSVTFKGLNPDIRLLPQMNIEHVPSSL